MKRFRKWGLCVLAILCLLLVACNQKPSDSPTTSSGSSAEQIASSETEMVSEDDESNDVMIVNSTSTLPIDLEVSFVGNATFTEGTSRIMKRFDANNGGTLELIDDTGNQWSLYIPPYSLHSSAEIEMVALNDITCDAFNVPFSGGIKLLPEGLTFITPVTLTVNTPEERSELIPLMGAGDGTNMEFIDFNKESQVISFNHFSSLVFTDRETLRTATTIGDLEKKALSKAERDLVFVRKFIKENKSGIEVPSPPVVSLACESEDTVKKSGEQNKKFLDDAFEPEGVMIRMMVSDLKGITFLEVDTPLKSELEHNISVLYHRLALKAIKLLDTYRGQPDYLVSVLQFAIKIAKEMDASNFSGEPISILETLMAKMVPFITSSLTPILERLTNEHDYRQAEVALKVATWAASIGDFDTSGIMEKVQAALKFNLSLSAKYVTSDSSYGVDASIPITFEYFSSQTGSNLHGNSVSVLNFTTSVPDTSMSAHPVPISVMITEFDPCSGMGYFVMDPLFVSSEIMTTDGESIALPIYKRWWDFAYEAYAFSGGSQLEYMNGDKLYKFPFTINNLNIETFSESIDGQNNSKGKMTITFEYKMTHTPGK